jgi:hypothetical protein
VAGIPTSTSNPALAQFAATAGQANLNDLAQYRTLRGRSRPSEVSLTANKELSPWLSVAFNGRLGWTSDQRRQRTALCSVPAAGGASQLALLPQCGAGLQRSLAAVLLAQRGQHGLAPGDFQRNLWRMARNAVLKVR